MERASGRGSVQREAAQLCRDVRGAGIAGCNRRHDQFCPGRPASGRTAGVSIGYVYVPALLAIVVGSVVCAPIGARRISGR
jgi:hypothetical protein